MADLIGLLREIMTLTEVVNGLRAGVGELNKKMEDIHERVVRLECREELIMEKTKNAAIQSVYGMNGQYFEMLKQLDDRIRELEGPPDVRIKRQISD